MNTKLGLLQAMQQKLLGDTPPFGLPEHDEATQRLADTMTNLRNALFPEKPDSVGRAEDNAAVDRFATAMKTRMADKWQQGYKGWDDSEQCSIDHLQQLLADRAVAGDPIDVANFAMMVWNRAEAKPVLPD